MLNKQERLEEQLLMEQMHLAKSRSDFYGVHKSPVSSKTLYKKPFGKSSRMKSYKFKTHLPSWQKFLNKEITLDQLKVMQRSKN